MSDQPRVSVIVPAYNRASTIERTLDSVLAQTHTNLQLIVVDDASTDATVERARLVGQEFPLTLIEQPCNGGACRARNAGLAAADGDFVAFLDSDDTWDPRFLEVLLARFADAGPEVGCAVASYRIYGDDGRVKGELIQGAEGDISQEMLRKNLIGATSCALIRTEVMRAIGGFDAAYPACQDYDLFIRLSQATRFTSTPEILFLYQDVDDPGRITRNQRKRLAGHLLIYRRHLRAHLKGDRHARANYMNYIGDILMRMGRPRAARRMFVGYAWVYKRKLRNYPRILMAAARVSPARYAAGMVLINRFYLLLKRVLGPGLAQRL
ncbi:glycosyltransferase family 2 protein [Rhodovibrio sodomensis]|nr:glycosyltransferase family 2 protein [Rhodovibrio sodomensis]